MLPLTIHGESQAKGRVIFQTGRVGVASDNGDRVRPRRVFIVDDHETTRDGFRWMFKNLDDLEVCGEAGDAATALAAIGESRADIAIVDVVLPERSGVDLIKDLRIRYPCLRIIAFTGYEEEIYAEPCLQAGANGFLTKPASRQEVVSAIRKVLAAELCVGERTRYRMLATLTMSLSRPWKEDLLTDRELQIYDLIGRGKPIQEIADIVHLSPDTVRTHRENIRKKLSFRDSTELAQHAARWVLMRSQSNGNGA